MKNLKAVVLATAVIGASAATSGCIMTPGYYRSPAVREEYIVDSRPPLIYLFLGLPLCAEETAAPRRPVHYRK